MCTNTHVEWEMENTACIYENHGRSGADKFLLRPVGGWKVYRDLVLKYMNPGGHCYWEGAMPDVYLCFVHFGRRYFFHSEKICCLKQPLDGNGQKSRLVRVFFVLFFFLSYHQALRIWRCYNARYMIWYSGGYEYEEFFLWRKQVVIFQMEHSLYGFVCLRLVPMTIEPDSFFVENFPTRWFLDHVSLLEMDAIRCFCLTFQDGLIHVGLIFSLVGMLSFLLNDLITCLNDLDGKISQNEF